MTRPTVEAMADEVAVDLFCGDALELMDKASGADLVITDPPYSSGARRDAERQVRRASMLREFDDDDWFSHDTMTTWGFAWFFRGLLCRLRTILPKGAHVYVFTDWRQTPNVYGAMESAGLRVNHCLVWNKMHYGMGSTWRNQHENIVFGSVGQPAQMRDRGMGSVISCRGVRSSDRIHPTEKPVELLETIVRAAPGDVVFDPFMGSGSTGVAARRAGRGFIGFDVDQQWVDIAAGRLGQVEPAGADGVDPWLR